jgi:S-adenosylmethionine:tRNA ribosyltransferase-isomerase
MPQSFSDIIQRYDYQLPPERIAQAPANPRDSSKLVVLNRVSGEKTWTTFREIGSHLPKNAVLVLNETKVIPARLFLTDALGEKVGALWVGTLPEGTIRVLAKGKFKSGEVFMLTEGKWFTVEGRRGKELILKPQFDLAELQQLFESHGTMPLPPYIDHSPLTEAEIKERYQSVFAKNPGSIAAPTASLHFTPELLHRLEESGIMLVRVTLHVHLGTFSPLTPEQWEQGKLHMEEYSISPEAVRALEQAKKEGRPIIPVGTTALRTLESAFDASGTCTKPEGETDIFIREGHDFTLASGLITNFHVPRSSLLMLVCAFAGYDLVMNTYREAIEREFRFFSFGDAMLIL